MTNTKVIEVRVNDSKNTRKNTEESLYKSIMKNRKETFVETKSLLLSGSGAQDLAILLGVRGVKVEDAINSIIEPDNNTQPLYRYFKEVKEGVSLLELFNAVPVFSAIYVQLLVSADEGQTVIAFTLVKDGKGSTFMRYAPTEWPAVKAHVRPRITIK